MTEEEIAALKKQLDEATAKATALENNKSRIIDESNDFKKRALEAETKLTEAEKKQLEKDGDLEALLKQQKEANAKLSAQLLDTQSNVIKSTLKAEVAKYAKDAHDVDMLLKVTDYKDLLKVNDDLSVDGVADFVTKARESHAYLFGKKAMPNTDDGANKDAPKDKKTVDEEYFAAMRACKTRRELHDVRVKFGKETGNFLG